MTQRRVATRSSPATCSAAALFVLWIGALSFGCAPMQHQRPPASHNLAPVANDDSAVTAFNTATVIAVLGNDSDPDGDSLVISSVTQGSDGAVTHGAAAVTYTPRTGFSGRDSFSYTISDGKGGTATATVTVTVNPVSAVNRPPAVKAGVAQTITLPSTATLSGTVADDGLPGPPNRTTHAWSQLSGPGAVTFGDPTTLNTTATFSRAGTYVLRLTASDSLLTSTDDVQITVNSAENRPPVTQNDFVATQPGTPVHIDVLRNDSDPDGDVLMVSSFTQAANGAVACRPEGVCTYTPKPSSSGQDRFTYTASDGKGGQSTATVDVNVTTVDAPPLDYAAAVTSIAKATEFLYTGANPIQTGVAGGTIDVRRVAVLRGKVLGRDGTALPAIKITVRGRPEFGQTFTRADGVFDLAVNGGGPLTIDYAGSNLLPVQRQVNPPWQDYAWLPDVVMIPVDDVTIIDLNANAPIQVARGSAISDRDGMRRETLLFPRGTVAVMTLPNNTTQTLTTLRVRSTEYTVGANGAQAMPAVLPPNSAYTYAAEFSADEAVAAGASALRFVDARDGTPKSIISYNENFLGFPVGANVPMGYYDANRGVWVSSDNGRVVKILSFANGKADLDVDGSGIAASAAVLVALGVTDAERAALLDLYPTGQSLWRSLIAHFSTWDKNQGTRCKEPCPNPPTPRPAPQSVSSPDLQCGSVIGCQNQTLGEAVGLTGTPFHLRYQSDRVPGYLAASHVTIPVTGPSISANLERIEVEVAHAGQLTRQAFLPAANLSYAYTWNGRDAYGRLMQGTHPVTVRLTYVYPLEYASTDRFGYDGNGSLILSNRGGFLITNSWTGSLGNLNAKAHGLGGWSLNVHHTYDPRGQILYLGDGGRRSAESLNSTLITTVAGNGVNESVGRGDGGAAIQAALVTPRFVAVGPDGSIYISDEIDNRIRRVEMPSGIITTVAGNGAPGVRGADSGDGGPATQATLFRPRGIAVAMDGSLYIASDQRIRRVEPGANGIITTVAGNGTRGSGGDGGPAINAQISNPEGVAVGRDGNLYIVETSRIRRVGTDGTITTVAGGIPNAPLGDDGPATQASLDPVGVAAAHDGSLYVVDRGGGFASIRRIGPDGIITRVAGNRVPGYTGDGGLATNARLQNPTSIAVGRDGVLFIADLSNQVIRQVGTDGIITTMAGNNTQGFSGDGGPATQAQLQEARGVAVGPDGSLYIADDTNNRIRRVASGLPGISVDDIAVAALDASEVYVFSNGGRHLRTRNALTGSDILTFTYDDAGRLAQVIQATGGPDNNVTTVERDTSGQPTAIVAPFGQRTALTVAGHGYLEAITNPADERVRLRSTADGLLTQFTDPKGNASQMTYDELGRLTRDINAAGGFKALARTGTRDSYTVNLSTALGLTTHYGVERLPNGDQRRVNLFPDGTKAELLIAIGGDRTTTLADGTITNLSEGPDPRFSMQAPIPKSVSTTTGDRTFTLTTTRTTTPADPLSFTSLTDTVTLNGHTFTSVYDVPNKTLTTTSAEGRKRQTVIDALGRVVQSEISGLLASNLTYTRGRLSRITRGTGGEERATILTYNSAGYLDTLTDPLGRTVLFGYDAAGRVKRHTLPDGRVVLYDYDVNGNLTALTPPGRPAHRFNFTPVDLQEEYTPPGVGAGANATRYRYRLDRQLELVTRPDGQILDFRYDDVGRLKTLILPSGPNGYGYDAATGKVVSLTTPDGGTLAYAYNGALHRQTTWTGTIAGNVTRTYDNDFRVESLSVNGSDAIAFRYDADGLLIQAGGLLLMRDAANGLLKATALGNVTDSVSYNGFGEIQVYSASYSGSEIFKTLFSHDKLGRIKTKTETVGGTTATFEYSYDLAGRLAEVKKNGAVTAIYTYDSNGNRLTGPGLTTAPSYDDQDRLTQYGGTTYSYTANGELKTKTAGALVTSYDYDVLGNLQRVTLPGGPTIDYVIDGRNRRIGKKVNGTFVRGFLYQDDLKPIAELDGTNHVVSRFVYGTHSNVPDYVIKGGVTYRTVTDHLGSPRLVIDVATGTVAQRMDYDEFGQVLSDTNPGFQPFGFAGGLYEGDMRLVRFGVRDYDPTTGRWTVKDPIGFGGRDTNVYAYAFNNPLYFTDPTGLYGTKSCDYYQTRCAQTGNTYYCSAITRLACHHGNPAASEAWNDCVRKCLQDVDKTRRKPAPVCTQEKGYDESDWAGDHAVCFASCGRDPNANWFTLQSYPNDTASYAP